MQTCPLHQRISPFGSIANKLRVEKSPFHFFQCYLVSVICLLAGQLKANAQPTLPLGPTNINTGQLSEYIIPNGISQISLEVVGGQGGNRESDECKTSGGEGARIRGIYLVSDVDCVNPNALVLKPGGKLRFVRGETGRPGGGGGGTAVLYMPPNGSTWVLLIVAGGGGGAEAYSGLLGTECHGQHGGNAQLGENGGDGGGGHGGNGGSGGGGGQAGGIIPADGGGGGGAYSAGYGGVGNPNGFSGGTVGGNGGTIHGDLSGGFGFGGGGASSSAGGGGGGYSGGGGGSEDGHGGGGGGGSYVVQGTLNVLKDHLAMGVFGGRIAIVATSGTAQLTSIYYVNRAVVGGNNNGSSWANAFRHLQDAIVEASTNCSAEIWVAKGTYYPDEVNGQNSNNRSSSFILRSGVKIYGGFSGIESNLSQRNWFLNKTFLSGDLLQNNTDYDNAQFLNYEDNAFHVISSENTDNTSVLDGFYIQSGNANGTGEEDSGGGIYMNNSGMTLINCEISFNHAYQGSGIYLLTSSPLILNCYIKSNKAISGGAGVYNNTNSSGYFYNCVFHSNQVGTTTPAGGGGGAILNYNNSNPDFVNCTISGNDAKTGGAVYNLTNAHPNFYNTIIWNNKSVLTLPISTDGSSSVGYFHCLVQGIDLSASNGNLNGLIGNSPFKSDVDLSQTPVATGNLQLANCSVAIDKGGVFFDQLVDLLGNPRVVNNIIDLGAYELQNPTPCIARLYVKWDATGSGDGTSWENACSKLQVGLATARVLLSDLKLPVEIWVAKGTYYPDEKGELPDNNPDNPEFAFFLTDSIGIYGGFAGTESSIAQRNWQTNPTILSGEIQQDDNIGNNAYHVVVGLGVNKRAIIDGFTVTGGNARHESVGDYQRGGGMYNVLGSGELTISNCTFTGNKARFNGGGMYNFLSSPRLVNCSFSENSALHGGGLYILNMTSPTLINCHFSENKATGAGGAIYNAGSSQFTNCSFIANEAKLGGGMYNTEASATLINCSFGGNSAETGSALYNKESSATLINCSIGGNTSLNFSAVYNFQSSPSITNCIIWDAVAAIVNIGNSLPSITYSIVKESYAGTGNLTLDPRYVDAANGNLRLQNGSPAVNAGNDGANNTQSDLDGNPRNVGTIDMGAYEFGASPPVCTDEIAPTFTGSYEDVPLGLNPSNPAASLGMATATDASGAVTITSIDGVVNGTCLKSQTRTFTAADDCGNTSTVSRTVIWTEDLSGPTVTKGSIAPCYKTVTDAENAAKNATTYSDNCTTNDQLVVSTQTAGTCTATITITVTDGANNSNSVSYTTKIDNAAPILSSYPENITLNCTTPIFPLSVTASDNCDGNVNVTLNETNSRGGDPTQSSYFNYTVTRTWSASDACGNTVAHTQTITVEDKTPPELTCPANMTISTEAGLCYADVTFNVIAFDPCGMVDTRYYLHYGTDEEQAIGSPWRFDVGSYSVTVVSTDVSGNSRSCTIALTVSDGEKPTVVTKNIAVQLDASGNATISNSAVNDGSSDNCTPQANLIFETSIKSFTCSNIGANTVILKVTDGSGNTATANATVTVEDKAKPTAITKSITVYLDGTGNATIADNAVNNGSSDNCTPQANLIFETNIRSFTCANIGGNTVILKVTDAAGNTATANATVAVEDIVKPNVITKNITVYLDGTGNATIADNAVNNGSSDNCTPQANLIFGTNIKSFTCANVGGNTVTLKVTDASGNTATASATVTAVDNLPPAVNTQNVTIYLNAAGQASVTAAQVNNNSTDNCSIPPNGYLLSKISFDCSNIGPNTVTLKVTDANGNTASASATVTVVDNLPPIVNTKNATIYLNASGQATLAVAQINNNSADNCSFPVSGYLLSKTDFDCSNIGTNTITLKVTDANGNTATAAATVTVLDNIAPTANCKNITVYLGTNGQLTIAAADVNNNSTDNCTSPAQLRLSVSRTTFDADDLGSDCLKAFSVTLTVTDGSGNSSTCTSSVTLKRRITKLVYNGAVEGQYSDPANLSATLYDITDGLPGTVLANKTVKFTIGTQSVSDTYGGTGGGTNATGIANGTIVLNQDPISPYTVVSDFAGDAVYCAATSNPVTFDIKPEDLCAEYNGQLSVAATVLSKTSNTAKVVMSVGLADDEDGNQGDVTKAKVEFNYGSGWVIVPVQALNAAKTLGNATLTVIINFSGDATTLGFGYRISGYYQINQECSDNGQSVINVYKPQGEFITGGGYIVPINKSVGIMPADSGRKANFGFNVKYNQKNTNLQGNINYIFRRKENGVIRLYQVKGNSMTSLTVNMNDAAEGGTKTAVFVGKCNVTDVTNPAAPVPVPNTGNSIMQVIVTDASESGATDKYGITVWNSSNQLFHSSNWESTKTTKLVLRGGNIVVSGVTSSPLTRSATGTTEPSPSGVNKSTMIEKTEASDADDKLKVVVMPNPSSTNFRIAIMSDNANDPVQMIVTDMLGRVMESRKITAGQIITIGDKYISGSYAVRVIQGKKIRQLTLIKISD